MKKIISIFLAMLMLLSISVPTLAAEIREATGTGTTDVIYTVPSEYTVTIPEFIIPVKADEVPNTYSVTANKVLLENGEEVKVTVSYDNVLTDKRGAELNYALYYEDNTEIVDEDTILTVDAGTPDGTASTNFISYLTEDVRYAGVFTDIVTFNFSIESKIYTEEEIEQDEHLYGIGRTKREYVVAAFNEDFTEVTISKNGEESDGLMQTMTPEGSVIYLHADTVTKAKVLDGVANIGGYTFYKCENINSVTIPESVTSIEHNAFQYCKGLTSIALPSNLTSIGGQAFQNCSSITSFDIPDTVNSIGQYAFANCTSLKGMIEIPEGVKTIGDMTFAGCNKLTSIDLPSTITSIGKSAFGACRSLTSIVIPKSVMSIGANAFEGCTTLTSITIPEGVTSIESKTFRSCSKLANITIPSSVTSIADDAFEGSAISALTTVYGVAGSYAEIWASEKGKPFVAVKGEELALPEKIHSFVNEPIKLYFLNATQYINYDNIVIEADTSGRGTVYSDRWEYTPTEAEAFALNLFVYDKTTNELLSKETFAVKVEGKTNADNLSVLVIGDSLVNAHTETETVLSLAQSGGYDITLLGTRGVAGSLNQHEGRGGWTAQMYCEKENAASGRVVNPFYNASIEEDIKFDFNYYMTTQGYEDVDCVVFQLGVNDVFSPRKDSELTPLMNAHLSYMEYMIKNVQAYNPNIKIILNLIVPCSSNQAHFDAAYEAGTIPERTAERCKVNTYTTNLALIEKFSNYENVYLSQFNTSINSESDFKDHVHPTTVGYTDLGTHLYSFIRAIN